MRGGGGARLPAGVSDFASTILNDTIYLVGGVGESNKYSSKSFEALSRVMDTDSKWTQLQRFPLNSFGSALVAVNNSLFLIGGQMSSEEAITYPYEYDFNLNTWTIVPASLPKNAEFVCVVSYETSIIVVDFQRNAYRSDDGAQTWTALSPMPAQQYSASCAVTQNGTIVIAGGQNGNGGWSRDAYVYNITANTWKTAAAMGRGRVEPSAVAVPKSDDVIVCGGYGDEGYHASCEHYNALEDRWERTYFDLNIPRTNFGLFIISRY